MLVSNASLESRPPRLWTISVTCAALLLVATVAALTISPQAAAQGANESNEGVVKEAEGNQSESRAAKADQEQNRPRPWKLANGTIMWESSGSTMRMGASINDDELDKLIKEKKYQFVRTFDSNNGEKEYVYRFTFSDGRRVNTNFSTPLENVSSLADYQQKQEQRGQRRHERINQAVAAGRVRLLNLELMQVHVCRDVQSGKKFKIQRIPLADHTEIAFPRADYGEIPPSVRQTSWQEHLQAIRDGKRELLELESLNRYTYEMTADDGTKEIFNYGGGEPLKVPKKQEKPAAQTPAIDSKMRELGESIRKRITSYSDVETMALKDGQAGRMKVKKNITAVTEILITPHFAEKGARFDLQGIDAAGKAIEGATRDSGVIHDGETQRTSLGKVLSLDGRRVLCKIQLAPKQRDGSSVVVEVKALFAPMPSIEEIQAARAQTDVTVTQTETVLGVRPQGNCSISGKVVSDATDKPIEHARMYLHYNVTHGSIFTNTAGDGTFTFKDIPRGPFSLTLSLSRGYQDASYNPEGKPGPWPEFSLQDGEHRAGILLKAKPACRVFGKVLGADGKMPENLAALTILAWSKRDDGKGYESRQARVDQADGSYMIDGLRSKPIYVMAINWQAAREGNAWPPIYYPSTFSRSDARVITFDKSPRVDDTNITLRKEGGIIIEGTVRDEAGKPVPEAFVVVDRPDMLFDFNTVYTDAQGHYQIQGLGDGDFLIHVDAVHRGFVRTRTPISLAKTTTKVQRDFTLHRGVLITGKLVDANGNEWQIGTSFGSASVTKDKPAKDQQGSLSSFSLTNFRNKHRPQDTERSSGGSFALGDGDYADGDMIFPTTSTFILQGMMPGHTRFTFLPNKEGQKVLKILCEGQDVLKSGLNTKPGEEIKDVTIVIGAESAATASPR